MVILQESTFFLKINSRQNILNNFVNRKELYKKIHDIFDKKYINIAFHDLDFIKLLFKTMVNDIAIIE